MKILEIEVQGGGSLKMWRQHFGRNSKFIGVDIDEHSLGFEPERISIVIGNQGMSPSSIG